MKALKWIKNAAVVLISVFSLPLVYFAGEWYDILWLRVVAAVLLIPYMIWWGSKGYNLVFGKKAEGEEDPEEQEETK